MPVSVLQSRSVSSGPKKCCFWQWRLQFPNYLQLRQTKPHSLTSSTNARIPTQDLTLPYLQPPPPPSHHQLPFHKSHTPRDLILTPSCQVMTRRSDAAQKSHQQQYCGSFVRPSKFMRDSLMQHWAHSQEHKNPNIFWYVEKSDYSCYCIPW